MGIVMAGIRGLLRTVCEDFLGTFLLRTLSYVHEDLIRTVYEELLRTIFGDFYVCIR